MYELTKFRVIDSVGDLGPSSTPVVGMFAWGLLAGAPPDHGAVLAQACQYPFGLFSLTGPTDVSYLTISPHPDPYPAGTARKDVPSRFCPLLQLEDSAPCPEGSTPAWMHHARTPP